MGNIYSLKCPLAGLELDVGKNGRLYRDADRQRALALFLFHMEEVGLPFFYCCDTANNGEADDFVYEAFDPDRDYEDNPVVLQLPERQALHSCSTFRGQVGVLNGTVLISEVVK